jgi:ribosomal protein L16 Arg81 hydroxylase
LSDLSTILSPLAPCEFLEKYWGIRDLYLKGPSDKFAAILTLETFERSLEAFSSFLRYPRVTMYADSHILHESRFTVDERVRISGALGYKDEALVDLEKVRSLLAKGATLKVSEADKISPELGRLVERLSSDLDERVHVNAYYSSPAVSTFAPHFDKHDVFILQIFGEKRWQVYDCRETAPVPGVRKARTEAYKDASVVDVNLAAGDVLYLPRGVWHHAKTIDSASLHITVGVECATSIEFIAWLVQRMSEDENLRRNLPREEFPSELTNRITETVRQLLERPELFSAFRRERRSRSVGAAVRILPGS